MDPVCHGPLLYGLAWPQFLAFICCGSGFSGPPSALRVQNRVPEGKGNRKEGLKGSFLQGMRRQASRQGLQKKFIKDIRLLFGWFFSFLSERGAGETKEHVSWVNFLAEKTRKEPSGTRSRKFTEPICKVIIETHREFKFCSRIGIFIPLLHL